MIRNTPPGEPQTRIRPQIQDMVTDNIAVLAERARHLDGVIPLWFGEGDLVTPGFIRDAAKRALDAGRTFYVPTMRGAPALTAALSAYQTRLHGRPDRGGAQHGDAGRHAGGGARVGPGGRDGDQRGLRDAAMAEHPPRNPRGRGRAAAVPAPSAPGSLDAGCRSRRRPVRRADAGDRVLLAGQPDRLDRDAG